MSQNALIILSIVSTLCAIYFGYKAFNRNRKQDDNEEGRAAGTMLSDIGYIKSGVDDLKGELKEQRKTNIEVVARITAVEESAKQAHKRIDEIKSAIQHD